jgi:nucleotide-binding universal stress UspA family protein
MIEIRRILCPVDFSDFSRRALDHAIAIAKWYQSTITLLHVHVLPVPYGAGQGVVPPPSTLTPETRKALLGDLERFSGSASAAGIPVECEIVEGPISPAILAKAEALPADLLVMGTHGRSGFERFVLGSVTERVVRQAPCPVLTVPRAASDVVPAPPVLFKRIICAVDFSDCSLDALEYALSLAGEADAHLTLLHVIELPPSIPREMHEAAVADPRLLRDYIAQAEEVGRARLQELVPANVGEFCTVDTMLATGKPYREILRVAEEQKAELLVLGIHGRGPIDRLLFGSTTQHLVRQATCPVLTLRKR